jgi:hypothetical protein
MRVEVMESFGRIETDLGLTETAAVQVLSGTIYLLRELSDDLAGVSRSEDIIWYVLGHHASSPNHRALADADTRANDRPAPDPNIGPNRHGLRKFQPFAPALSFDRMSSRINLHEWTKQHVAPDRDLHDIEHHAVEVEEYFAAQSNVRAVIAKERWLHPRVRFGAKKLGQYSPAFLLLPFMRVVKSLAEIPTTLPLATEHRVKRVIQLACEHFFFFTSDGTHDSAIFGHQTWAMQWGGECERWMFWLCT